ncbi:BaiN/RdsA family NAD(P)/FAD-dependent oxidoreductase [Sphingomonas radiodurans]|uniref:NAD(P)/FAD-dependent oxidoreductase n=1 Tax=Sphingomonas radiodurans TaxID=2890321 RepID=UPI001E6521BB|nr:NAD(P)/FAD-dependent oxidoreductase [Sphingomonas radiodurans]WBH18286.1 NAD(P)/FAD-dependent oxidoreductase [Sphingomonas radiodurans]
MCAATAGQQGKRVLVIDHAEKAGKKILISGGGRCNFTNTGTTHERFISANPHFARSALARYTPADFIALVDRYGIAWHEKTLGQLFCDGSARQIVAMLLEEGEKWGVKQAIDTRIAEIQHADGEFRVTCSTKVAQARALVIATGGPSIPKMGATGFAYDLARQFGLKVVEPRPALVPLTLGGDDPFRALAGVATEVIARAGKAAFREAMLFTHRGLSGPAVLQVSSYWRHGEPIAVDLLPDRTEGWLRDAKRTTPRAQVGKLLAGAMPQRLAEALVGALGISGELANVADAKLAAAERALAAWRFAPNGSEGFAKAEVTVGGVSTAELSSQTMEAKRVPGLYVIGEAVDVTGWLGGYNFQWAWASGWAAGMAV